MKRLNQNGIAALEVILPVVIVCILSFVGWYVWHSQQKTDAILKQASNSKLAASTPKKLVSESRSVSRAEIDASSASRVAFSKLPVELRNVAIAENEKQSPGCVKDGSFVDADGNTKDVQVPYAPVGSAIISIGCESGAAGLFVKDLKTGEWKFAQATQSLYDCDVIFLNPVPKALLVFGYGDDVECMYKNSETLSFEAAYSKYFY
jgi:hypothetical protein